ncbi:glucose-1-phosphate adenylyltransferase large subunit 2, chloroplastic/amyloplastic isoform X1 [Zea mays]|uniref:Glucose-1-phosphate adenylyltransferase n=4 Tax=Zea mays TaxID=4577 RepID=B6TCZ8_MAIZE|nr:glucose-1-phosphate adenylyltransferase large subunit 2, chloroplastic/amyloplastic [Zea mays]XP_020394792.1 glucose-1-phosphate adenylyltransferase large subunit 2, chloroplastic/amyloplastic isoform X1 [Zea mays]ACG34981.1 glucose-1-phosphate adenylyltransferase large subunit [Zea mays]ACN28262.1 unknown [Zea mays]AQK88788.1 ADP glucose pyrophosphorylase2 [Zea mays]AQK88793.1 ADP glucose pyrophosphorylase2 [Zea mays]AQK88797.1 ADP glucose pyrophosphorylase2 [Zea mays]|eukprot:NP_001105717.2 glucose-1-phosphate adenylyltransferase large subunit 2, chloroplastic/amyloplastic [Zea mays]
MQFSSVLPLEGKACMSPVRRGSGGYGSERMRINCCSIRRNKALRRMCFSARGAVSSTQCVLTSDAGPDTLVVRTSFRRNYADPNEVAAVILGGGTGTQLFPLTSTRATPAVPIGGCYRLIDIPMSNCFNSGINKIFVMTQFNSASLNRHIHRTYLGGGINFTDGSVEVLAATQMPGEAAGWFQGTADAVRKFIWVLEDYYKHKAIEHILILSGDQLYRMDYMELVQKHVDDNADITLSCAPVGESRASDYGLVKFDSSGRVIQFSEKPKGAALEEMKVDTSFLNFAIDSPAEYPYIASMGVYVFKRDVLLDLLKSRYAELHDFGSEILPKALHEHNVQAYVFTDYWEDIGTIRSFFDANMALCEQPPKFEFYDPKTPFFTSPRYLPPTKSDKCRIKDAIISHGCFLRECAIEHSIVGVRSRLNSGCELKNTMMMGADLYETEDEISRLLAEGKVPIGVGENTKISNCIIDMNARVGRNVSITNKEGVQEADRPDEGYYIRSGIVVVLKNATIKDGTVI